jgi:rod shape-determining protein MreD
MDNTKRRKIEEVIWLEVRTLLIVAFFVIGQRLLMPTVFQVAINVMLLLVVIQVLIEPIPIVARWAFYAGLVLDIVSGTWLGWHSILLLLAMLAVYAVLARITSENWLLPIVAVVLGGLTYHAFHVLFTYALVGGFDLAKYVVVVFIPELAVILIPALPVFLLLRSWRGIRRGEVPIDVY